MRQLFALLPCARMMEEQTSARGHVFPQSFFWAGCCSGQQDMSSMPAMASICMSDERAMALAAVPTLTGPSTIPSNANTQKKRRSAMTTNMRLCLHSATRIGRRSQKVATEGRTHPTPGIESSVVPDAFPPDTVNSSAIRASTYTSSSLNPDSASSVARISRSHCSDRYRLPTCAPTNPPTATAASHQGRAGERWSH